MTRRERLRRTQNLRNRNPMRQIRKDTPSVAVRPRYKNARARLG